MFSAGAERVLSEMLFHVAAKACPQIVAWRTLGMARSAVDNGIQPQCEVSFDQLYKKQDAFISFFCFCIFLNSAYFMYFLNYRQSRCLSGSIVVNKDVI